MGNMADYLDWRGDLTFQQAPFNEVDNLILAQLSYVNLDGIAPGVDSGDSITLKEASEHFFRLHDKEELAADKSFVNTAPFLMQRASTCRRFSDVHISHYRNDVDTRIEKQFAAMQFHLGNRLTYVAFRGTDDTIVGWKEDFNFSYAIVPAQKEATAYLEKTTGGFFQKYILGGHSKGGNLAIYAAATCGKYKKRHIVSIYNNDGPGFLKTFISSVEYASIRDRIHSIVPYNSIIGMLLEQGVSPIIVSSSQHGILQHDAMSWQVEGDHFLQEQALSKESQTFDATMKAWLNELGDEEKKVFIDDLFGVLEATGATTLTELQNGGLKNVATILKSFGSMDPASRDMIGKLLQIIEKARSKETPIKDFFRRTLL